MDILAKIIDRAVKIGLSPFVLTMAVGAEMTNANFIMAQHFDLPLSGRLFTRPPGSYIDDALKALR